MLTNLAISIGKTQIACQFPKEMLPDFYNTIFKEMCMAYYCAAQKPPEIPFTALSQPVQKMISRYYELNKLPIKFRHQPRSEETYKTQQNIIQDPEKKAVMLSGGKDSIHLLLKLLEVNKAENVFAIYVKNINKSETYYEEKAVRKVCKSLGVDYKVVVPTNSVKLNRKDHNIAFREPLCLVLAIPYLLEKNIKDIYFGSLVGFTKIDPKMYCSSKECLELLNDYFKMYGFSFNILNQEALGIKSYLQVFKEMVENYPQFLKMSSSCYTQINFREHRYGLLQKKIPDIPIYDGCGSCLKCHRINSAILLWDQLAIDAPIEQQRYLYNYIRQFWRTRYATDTSLNEHLDRLASRYTEKYRV